MIILVLGNVMASHVFIISHWQAYMPHNALGFLSAMINHSDLSLYHICFVAMQCCRGLLQLLVRWSLWVLNQFRIHPHCAWVLICECQCRMVLELYVCSHATQILDGCLGMSYQSEKRTDWLTVICMYLAIWNATHIHTENTKGIWNSTTQLYVTMFHAKCILS